eukprot:857206-Pyramimonas_sp.AAC.1
MRGEGIYSRVSERCAFAEETSGLANESAEEAASLSLLSFIALLLLFAGLSSCPFPVADRAESWFR